MLPRLGAHDCSMVILRTARSDDVAALVAVQQPAAVQGLGHIFPQDRYPFPLEQIAARWQAEVADPAVRVYVCTERDGAIRGFAAVRDQELLHFGTALDTWGTGLASDFHDALLDAVTDVLGPVTLTLRVFEENHRARRFYDKRGWRPTGRSSRTTFAPHPVLLEYERHLGRERDRMRTPSAVGG